MRFVRTLVALGAALACSSQPAHSDGGTDASAHVLTIAGGPASSCALLADGTIKCWGQNAFGELGVGTSTGPETCSGFACALTAVAVSTSSRATAVTAGSPTCALLADGTVACWGNNASGELGEGTSTGPQACDGYNHMNNSCSMTPVVVPGLKGVTAITADYGHACALLSDGTVTCWGDNSSGELGLGTSTGPETCGAAACSTTPAPVSGLSGVTAMSAGGVYTCALLSGGTIACWGDNVRGELGDGSSTGPETCATGWCSTTPVAVPGLSGVTAISTGYQHVCALLSNGTVECWGDNSNGQLGTGSTTGPDTCAGTACARTPVAVQGLSGVTAIAAGQLQTCALLSGGAVECWGDNSYGELGDGTNTAQQKCMNGYPCSATPVVVSSLSAVTSIAAGHSSTCAIAGGTVECWGFNGNGELGNGTSNGPQTCSPNLWCSTIPVVVSGL